VRSTCHQLPLTWRVRVLLSNYYTLIEGAAVTASQTYSVILEPLEEGGFLVHVPAFPEIWVEGETEEEVLDGTKDAIERVIASYVERGAPLPAESRKPVIRVLTFTPPAGT
jgi:predicted RNase H-like HicB family nuclease